jgi:hypothetical protein
VQLDDGTQLKLRRKNIVQIEPEKHHINTPVHLNPEFIVAHVRRVVHTGEGVDAPVAIGVNDFTPLMLACQWKGKVGRGLSIQDVRGLLAAGSNVNATIGNGCSAMFFAVKYSDAETVSTLLDAKADLTIRDTFRRNALCNAVEHRDPEIVKLLLDRGLSAAEEQDIIHAADGHKSVFMNPAERMIHVMDTPPISWQLGGAPSLESELRTFELLVNRGALLSHGAMEHVGLLIMQNRGAAHKRFVEVHTLNQLALAHRIMGRQHDALTGFYASAKTHRPQKGENAGVKDIASTLDLFGYRSIETTIDRLRLLTDAQVQLECNELQAQGLLVAGSCQSPEDRLAALHQQDTKVWRPREVLEWMSPIMTKPDGSTAPTPPSCLQIRQSCFETAGSHSIVMSGTGESVDVPALGPVCIPIKVDGTPVYGYLSTTSVLTIVGQDFADYIGLRYIKLRTSNKPFVHRAGVPADCSLIPRLVVSLPGGLTVTLTTAVVIPNYCRGVQLGHDFFAASLRCEPPTMYTPAIWGFKMWPSWMPR